ncbi:DUF1127 domain-containing protein [Reyranella sp.]|uniref:DUF1127 domain-containing protein n=1 Tax=Reyranella sp. TaxID=1929291 RepID=UPI003783F985
MLNVHSRAGRLATGLIVRAVARLWLWDSLKATERTRDQAIADLRSLDNHLLADVGVKRAEIEMVAEIGGGLPERSET